MCSGLRKGLRQRSFFEDEYSTVCGEVSITNFSSLPNSLLLSPPVHRQHQVCTPSTGVHVGWWDNCAPRSTLPLRCLCSGCGMWEEPESGGYRRWQTVHVAGKIRPDTTHTLYPSYLPPVSSPAYQYRLYDPREKGAGPRFQGDNY